ncbi:MAG: alanine--glyoxylate aminotransferase family protein, partial [Deltaproteobacteria bacterium]|nr:alanine--glyoxylate aminotransferase family protein [Deltaproteobacteria bacterium]
MSSFRKTYLLTPGPTMIPPAVVEARAKQLPHHRTPEFVTLLEKVHERLRPIFCTNNKVYSLAASGSGAMEAAVASLLSPGDTAICIDAGKFGQRWIDICKRYGINVVTLAVERGAVLAPEALANALAKHPSAKAVLTQLVETSTGVKLDIKGFGEITRKTETLLVVDAISGLCAEEYRPDDWGVDVTIAGSQKGFMLPPGLSFVSLSEKAWRAAEHAKCPCYYLDLRKYRKGQDAGDHPFTPAISLYIELDQVLHMIEAETLEKTWKRHAWLAKATRAAVTALELPLFTNHPSNAVTTVTVPANLDGGKLVKTLR